jgi:hypothetical protein
MEVLGDVGTELFCLKYGKNKKLRNHRLREVTYNWYGVLAGTTKSEPDAAGRSNQDSTVVNQTLEHSLILNLPWTRKQSLLSPIIMILHIFSHHIFREVCKTNPAAVWLLC